MSELILRNKEYPIYDISDSGEVRHSRTGRVVRPHPSRHNNAPVVQLCDKFAISRTISLKRLITETFLDGPHDNCDVICIDGDEWNVHVDNLMWVERDYYEPYRNKREYIRVVETGEEFESIYECSEKLGVTIKSIKRCLGNINYVCKAQYHLEYIEE